MEIADYIAAAFIGYRKGLFTLNAALYFGWIKKGYPLAH